MEEIGTPGQHSPKSTAWVSVFMLAVCNTFILREPWKEEWKDAREDIDSGFAVFAWLLGFGLTGPALIATASVTELFNEPLTDFLLFVGLSIGLLGLGGFFFIRCGTHVWIQAELDHRLRWVSVGLSGILTSSSFLTVIVPSHRKRCLGEFRGGQGLSVSGDGIGVIAHTSSVALPMVAERTGLVKQLSEAIVRRSFVPLHDRGQVRADVGVMLADGGQAISDINVLRHQSQVRVPHAFGGGFPTTETVTSYRRQ